MVSERNMNIKQAPLMQARAAKLVERTLVPAKSVTSSWTRYYEYFVTPDSKNAAAKLLRTQNKAES